MADISLIKDIVAVQDQISISLMWLQKKYGCKVIELILTKGEEIEVSLTIDDCKNSNLN